MNSTAKALVFAVIAVASAASIGMGLAERSQRSSTTTQEVVKLERVVIVGKRAPTLIAQLPRVVITGHRNTQPSDTVLAAACSTTRTC